MINNNLKFMKSKEIRPYEFFLLDESHFQELISVLKLNGGDYKISTMGYVREYDSMNNESLITYENKNFSIKLNTSRISSFFQWNVNTLYVIYGILKCEKDQIVLYVNFFRNIEDKFDLESFKVLNLNRREIIYESQRENIFI